MIANRPIVRRAQIWVFLLIVLTVELTVSGWRVLTSRLPTSRDLLVLAQSDYRAGDLDNDNRETARGSGKDHIGSRGLRRSPNSSSVAH
jgi:hypothetical protein